MNHDIQLYSQDLENVDEKSLMRVLPSFKISAMMLEGGWPKPGSLKAKIDCEGEDRFYLVEVVEVVSACCSDIDCGLEFRRVQKFKFLGEES